MIMKMSRELQGDNHEDDFNEYFVVFIQDDLQNYEENKRVGANDEW